MGSSLSPLLTGLFVSTINNDNNYFFKYPKLYTRYVADISICSGNNSSKTVFINNLWLFHTIPMGNLPINN